MRILIIFALLSAFLLSAVPCAGQIAFDTTKLIPIYYDWDNDTSTVLLNAATWLDLKVPESCYDDPPSPSDSNIQTHPSIVYFPYEWNGYRYWLFTTPYANANVEDPCLYVGNSKTDLHPFIDSMFGSNTFGDTLYNPIDTALGIGYNSDVHGFYDERTDKLWCTWREKKGGVYAYVDSLYYSFSRPESTWVYGRWTRDGLRWSERYTLLTCEFRWVIDSAGGTAVGTRQDTIEACGYNPHSHSIEYIDGKYKMWAMSKFEFFNQTNNTAVTFHETSLYLWEADSMEGTWDTASYCDLELAYPSGAVWHPEVFWGPDDRLLCLHDQETFSYPAYVLTLLESTDSGRTFTLINEHVVNTNAGSWDDRYIYKASPLFDDYHYSADSDLYGMLGVYYSALTNNVGQHIGYTEGLWPTTRTDIEEQAEHPLPDQLNLRQNYPNPFNMSTRIEFELARSETVTLNIYNVLGEKVARLVDGADYPSGSHVVEWDGRLSDGSYASSGVYFYQITTSSSVGSKKMIVLK